MAISIAFGGVRLAGLGIAAHHKLYMALADDNIPRSDHTVLREPLIPTGSIFAWLIVKREGFDLLQVGLGMLHRTIVREGSEAKCSLPNAGFPH